MVAGSDRRHNSVELRPPIQSGDAVRDPIAEVAIRESSWHNDFIDPSAAHRPSFWFTPIFPVSHSHVFILFSICDFPQAARQNTSNSLFEDDPFLRSFIGRHLACSQLLSQIVIFLVASESSPSSYGEVQGRKTMVVNRRQTSSSRRLRLEAQQASTGFLHAEAQGEQLLPGVLNEITLQQIVPKLSWRDSHALSLTCRYWRDAIQSHHVYDARVQLHSAETFILMSYGRSSGFYESFPAMALVSMKDDFCKELPPLPHLHRPGIPANCRSVSLNGKIYVLGGVNCVSTSRVFVLDLAGKRGWKECARMQHARQGFGCVVLGGKIYVFGGDSSRAEVYDPKENTWSQISRPTMSLQNCHNTTQSLRNYDTAAILGEEIFLFSNFNHELPLCIYDPSKDAWRVLTSLPRRPEGTVFSAHGKLCALRYNHLHVLDIHGNSWTKLQSCSFAPCGLYNTSIKVPMHSVPTVDGEILAILMCEDIYSGYPGLSFLARSRGFGCETEEITWKKVHVDLSFSMRRGWSSYFMCTVDL